MGGTNRHLSVGADSTIAPVLATGVAAVAVAGRSGYGVAMAVTALLVGAALVAVGAFRLGWIAEFLSTPVITGVLAGIAVEIVVRQIPAILGVPGQAPVGPASTIGEVRRVASQLGHVNGWSAGHRPRRAGGDRHRAAHRPPAPRTLAGLILSVAAVHLLGLASRHGVAVLGPVRGGLPHVRLPYLSWSQLRRLPGLVLTVTFVCIAQTAATVRASGPAAKDTAAHVDFNRDLISIEPAAWPPG